MILLLIGTNDYGQGYDTLDVTNRLEALLTRITTFRPFAKVIVAKLLERSPLPRKTEEPLRASLNAAIVAFDWEAFTAGANQPGAFQAKVRAQVAPFDPALAGRLISAAQVIIDAVAGDDWDSR